MRTLLSPKFLGFLIILVYAIAERNINIIYEPHNQRSTPHYLYETSYVKKLIFANEFKLKFTIIKTTLFILRLILSKT